MLHIRMYTMLIVIVCVMATWNDKSHWVGKHIHMHMHELTYEYLSELLLMMTGYLAYYHQHHCHIKKHVRGCDGNEYHPTPICNLDIINQVSVYNHVVACVLIGQRWLRILHVRYTTCMHMTHWMVPKTPLICVLYIETSQSHHVHVNPGVKVCATTRECAVNAQFTHVNMPKTRQN